MDIETAIKQTSQEFLNRSKANTAAMFEEQETVTAEEPVEISQPVDMWQQQQQARANLSPTQVHGAKPRLTLDLMDLLESGPIKDAYKKTINDSDLLRAEGETERARLLEQQYMQDYFYPTIDALIRLNSMEEVLASQDALEILDSLAIMPGGGRADGYTSVYISSLYEPAGNTFRSDAQVREAVQRLQTLCNSGQVSQAGALAKRMQAKIDSGQNVALPEDYEIIQRIALRTS